MKKLITLILIFAFVMGLSACSHGEEKKLENKMLSLTFELNGKTYTYNIEYDSDNTIVKVDNTDYYEFLQDGELITDVTILDTELTAYFIEHGGKAK